MQQRSTRRVKISVPAPTLTWKWTRPTKPPAEKSNVHVLWGGKGTVGALWDVLATWREKSAAPVTGRAIDCGHFLQEERPQDLLRELVQFL
jgi:surfactin synthase thioesterase subunit